MLRDDQYLLHRVALRSDDLSNKLTGRLITTPRNQVLDEGGLMTGEYNIGCGSASGRNTVFFDFQV